MRNRWQILISIVFFAACSKAPRQEQRPVAMPPAAVELPATLEEAEHALRDGHREIYEASLRNMIERGDHDVRRRALVRLAFFYASEKRHTEAAATFRAAAHASPRIAHYLSLRLVDALAAAGNYADAIAVATPLISSPQPAVAAEARIRLPELYARSGQTTLAEQSSASLGSVAIDEFSEGVFVRTADALETAGLKPSADSIRLRMLTTYPQSRYTEKIYGQLTAGDSPLMQLDAQRLLDVAEKLGRYNRYDQALDLLGRIESSSPATAETAYFRYVKLRSLFNSRNYGDAAKITIASSEPFYLAAELLRARAHWRDDQNTMFKTLVETLIRKYPGSKEATEGRILLSKYYVTDEIDYEKSVSNLRTAIASGAKGEQGENIWNLGWTYFLAERHEDALRTFDEYLASYPDADYTTNSLFWSAKIHARLGDTAKRDEYFGRLVSQFPYSYYAYRARQITGAPLYPPDRIEGREPFPELNAAVAADAATKLVVVRELLDLGMSGEAARELKATVGAAPEDPALAYHLAELYASANEPLKAMGLLQRRFRNIIRHGSSNVPTRFWQLLFPLAYWEQIKRGAAHSGVDPYLMAAIIRQESAFDPSVVSNAGAVGLMQIMPQELDRIAADGNLPPMTRSDLFDPEKVTLVGAAEFKQKLARMDGNTTLAIASYNAGEEAVGRWIAKTPTEDVDVFIDSIPYAETRLYVKNVTRNYFEYRRIYERQPSE